MLKIRLKRVGRKHDPSFRLVVVESRRGPKSGRYLEHLGSYDARTNAKNVNGERVRHWLSVGAQVSDTAHNLLVDLGVVTGKKINVLPRKLPTAKEVDESAAQTSATTPEEKPDTVGNEDSSAEDATAATPKEETPTELNDTAPVEERGNDTKEEKA
jgi:small subunit ribosomal protein S16